MSDLLDFSQGRGQRAASFRFELLDNHNSVLGDLDVAMAGARVSNQTGRAVKRSMDGIRLAPTVTAQVNTLEERIRPWMLMEDGTEWPLGVFLFADASRMLANLAGGYYALAGPGRWTEATCLDQLATVNQKARGINFYPAGHRVDAALLQQLEVSGITEYELDATDAVITQPVVWKPGSTNRLTIFNELLAMAGFYSLWFDRMGVAQLRRVPSLDAATDTITYNLGSAVYLDSIVETDGLMDAPNVYQVTNSSFQEAAIWGEWQVPASAPHSVERRRYPVVETRDIQGLESRSAAAEAARAWGMSDYSTYRYVNFDTPPMPQHDTWDVLTWLDGDRYREQGWDMTLEEGARMSHEGRRVWAESVADLLMEDAGTAGGATL